MVEYRKKDKEKATKVAIDRERQVKKVKRNKEDQTKKKSKKERKRIKVKFCHKKAIIKNEEGIRPISEV